MRSPRSSAAERGVTLIELLIALAVLSLGILAVGGLFPAGTRGQLQDRMMSSASFYAQQKIEELNNLTWSDPALVPGRHPAGTVMEVLGNSGAWQRYYEVTAMAAPLDNLRKVVVTVTYQAGQTRTVTATTYVRR